MTSADSQQDRFHDLVTFFVNGGCLLPTERTRVAFQPGVVFRRNATVLCEAYRRLRHEADSPARVIEVDVYDGANRFVLDMAKELPGEGLAGAYIHGSLATGEEVPYSDFDALVILGDELFDDARRLAAVARRLSDARRHMFRADPLQHHGWSVLTEADLRCYRDEYFPEMLFRYSRSLLPDRGRRLTIRKRGWTPEISFDEVASACAERLAGGRFLRSAYLTKCALSEFMLLPTLYLQAKEGQPVYKKESFDLARRHFTAAEWECMDRISRLRLEWEVPMGGWMRRLLSVGGALRGPIVKHLSPALPQRLRLQITPALIEQMTTLIRRMQESLGR